MAQKRHSHPITSQSKKPRRKIVHIGDDIIFFEILTKLPVKSILRFRTVNKSWHDITYDPCFISRQLEHSRKNPKLTIMPYDAVKNTLDLYLYDCEEGDNHCARFLFGKRLHNYITELEKFPQSNGLVLYNTARRLLVCNPSTRKSIKLPPGSPNNAYDSHTYLCLRGGFGFVSLNTDDTRPAPLSVCKVVQYFYRKLCGIKRTFSVGFEVFHVGIDSSWRAVAVDPPYPPLLGESVCTSRAVYFFIDNELHKSAPQLVLSFDIKHETYSVIPPPPCFSDSGSYVKASLVYNNSWFNYSLHEIDDSICLAVNDYLEESKCDIWKYKEDSSTWILYFRIQSRMCRYSLGFVKAQNGKLLMQVFDGIEKKLVWYDPQTGSFELMINSLAKDISYLKRNNIVHLPDQGHFRASLLVESLVPVTGMIGH